MTSAYMTVKEHQRLKSADKYLGSKIQEHKLLQQL